MTEEEPTPRSLRGTRSLERNDPQKYGKFCHMFVNGDRFYPGATLFFPHRLKTLDAVKDEITVAFDARDKPICPRNLFTPTTGRRIETLDDFLDAQDCVIASTNKFRPYP